MALQIETLKKVATAKTKDGRKLTYYYERLLEILAEIGWTEADAQFAGFTEEADYWRAITEAQHAYAKNLYNTGGTTWDMSGDTQLAIFPHFDTAKTDVNFSGCTALKYIPILTVTPDTMAAAFKNCGALISANLSGWSTSAVTDWSEAFANCQSINAKTIDTIKTLNTSAATTFAKTFQGFTASKLELQSWSTSAVTTFERMFNNAAIATLRVKFDFASATTISYIFNGLNASVLDMSGSKFTPSTGCASVDIFNAETNAIARVTATGITTQTGTPTTAAPVPVRCNNGDVYVDYIGATYPISALTAEEEQYAYGVEIDYAGTGYAAVTRIGNAALHASLPVQAGMVGGYMLDNGVFREFSAAVQADWTQATRDGSLGQIMTKLPRHYVRIERTGDKQRVKISTHALKGYRYVPNLFVGYEFVMDRTSGKGCSIVNTDARYRGGSNTAAWDGTYRTSCGRGATNLSMAAYRTAARLRGSGWEGYNHYVRHALTYLYVIEYASLNSQAEFNATLTTEGYHQGGLGAGVTEWTSSEWSNYNDYNPFVPVGHTDSLGNTSGVVNYEVKNADNETIHTAKVNRYRGVEMPFGHVWKFVDGLILEVGAATATNLNKCFVAENPTNWGDTDVNNPTKYNYIGNQARANGNGRVIDFSTGALEPVTTGNGYDYNYGASIPSSGVALRCGVVGGDAGHGAYAGLFCFYSSDGVARVYAGIGSRLCFIGK